jgi:hypothetical protein
MNARVRVNTKAVDWTGPATLVIGGAAWASIAVLAWVLSQLLYFW